MRRLRENAALEPEINKTGDVVVEGHVIGRLDGFMFVADASSGGSEAKALQNAAQKALAGEIGARATRLAEAPDEQFALAADGAIRWTGAAVGKLIAGEQVLRPRVRIIADEHLTGAPRDAVEARLDALVKSHLEKLLGPLFVLSAAEDVTGIARGVAFQLVEALGVLERQKVAEDVKGLEQPARATLAQIRRALRRLSHLHSGAAQARRRARSPRSCGRWRMTGRRPRASTICCISPAAAAPRSRSIARSTRRSTAPPAIGSAASARCASIFWSGLADLIRPALSWREGAPGTKPPGAIAGGGFTVVNGMTSLTGASGEDFASILRSLGYRMERRPKPAEPAPSRRAGRAGRRAGRNRKRRRTSDPGGSELPSAVEGEAASARERSRSQPRHAVQEPLEAALQPAADVA